MIVPSPIFGEPDGADNLPPGVALKFCKWGNNEISDQEFIQAIQLSIDAEAPEFPKGITIKSDADIPNWLSNNLKWWCAEQISYSELIAALKFLFDQQVIPEDLDIDGDGIENVFDNCPENHNPDQKDSDQDGPGDKCDNAPLAKNTNQADEDGDSVGDVIDNCIATPNSDQSNRDGDNFGDLCDVFPDDAENDTDGDGIPANSDNCPNKWNEDQLDSDLDGIGDSCDSISDLDNDGVSDSIDNCKTMANPDQKDSDNDNIGDVCDSATLLDADKDGIHDGIDNCKTTSNPNQKDSDEDGIGDECDPTPDPLGFSITEIPELEVTVGDEGTTEFSIYLNTGSPEDIHLSCHNNLNENIKCKISPKIIRPTQIATLTVTPTESTVSDKRYTLNVEAKADDGTLDIQSFTVNVKPLVSSDLAIEIIAIVIGVGLSLGIFIFERNRRSKKA